MQNTSLNVNSEDAMQEQELDLTKNKCDEVHVKLDKSEELPKNRSTQLEYMCAVLMNVTHSNNVTFTFTFLVQMLQTKEDQLMNTMTYWMTKQLNSLKSLTK
jgi:hypothetical protein